MYAYLGFNISNDVDIDRQLIRRKDVENGFGLVSEMFHLPARQGMAG